MAPPHRRLQSHERDSPGSIRAEADRLEADHWPTLEVFASRTSAVPDGVLTTVQADLEQIQETFRRLLGSPGQREPER